MSVSFLRYRALAGRPGPFLAFESRVTRLAADNTAGDFVLYHCHAARRMRRNLALDVAVTNANALGLPVLVAETSEPDANARLQAVVRDGVDANRRDAEERGLGYVFTSLASVRQLAARARLVVADEFPTRPAEAHLLVDGNGILPMRVFEKEQYSAKFFRDRAHRLFPELWSRLDDVESQVAFHSAIDIDLTPDPPVDEAVPPVPIRGGRGAGLARLAAIDLHGYGKSHRHPGTGLSPYLHFGHLGIHEVAEHALDAEGDVDDFLEQAVIRRELSFNLCFFNPRYASLLALPEWARKTLDAHRHDRRKPLYTATELEAAATHDDVWNLAQRQLVEGGTMHGYLRMLWGKKAIEWMETPEEAHAFLIAQHAKYALDGRDPNTHAGVLWCFGKHDRPWAPERPIFGMVRYMSSDSTRRKLGLRL